MGPPKKRMRTQAPDAPVAAGDSSTLPSVDDIHGSVSISKIETATQALLRRLESLRQENENGGKRAEDEDALTVLRSGFLLLRGWQRDLLDSLQGSQSSISEQKTAQEKKELRLAALRYERTHLEREIEGYNNFTTPHLQKLAREEGATAANKKATESTQEDGECLQAFLQADVNNPDDRQKIIAKLHQELNARGGLERDLKSKQDFLGKLQAKLKKKQDFLKMLPDQLRMMERASQPLQKFMRSSAVSDSQALRMIGSERRTRLELAQSLPGPLYTLFTSLQQYIDRRPAASLDNDNPTMDGRNSSTGLNNLSISVSGDSENKQVILHIPVPEVTVSTTASTSGTSGRSKRVALHFQYSTDPEVVTAVASGCGSTLNQELLLEELFPHDSPTNNVESSASVGKAYHWCNYLAGLYQVRPSVAVGRKKEEDAMDVEDVPKSSPDLESTMATSTRVIVRELQRRVRANATLKYILQSLQQRHHVPVPPGGGQVEKGTAQSNHCRLVGFSPVDGSPDDGTPTSPSEQYYSVQLRKGSSTNLNMMVRLHKVRYPAVAPVWTLNVGGDGGANSDHKSVLYDDRLALLERQVNVEALTAPQDGQKGETNGEDPAYYDWILVHQLQTIMQQWDQWSDETTGGDGRRKVRGRDRVPVK